MSPPCRVLGYRGLWVTAINLGIQVSDISRLFVNFLWHFDVLYIRQSIRQRLVERLISRDQKNITTRPMQGCQLCLQITNEFEKKNIFLVLRFRKKNKKIKQPLFLVKNAGKYQEKMPFTRVKVAPVAQFNNRYTCFVAYRECCSVCAN
jgi:hypothetical protein